MLRPWKLELLLDYHSDKALYLQIADAIIVDILSGRLQRGIALPGSRKLAAELNVNRNTVVEALQVLLVEEYLISKERKGTFVAEVLPVNQRRSVTKKEIVISETMPETKLIRFDDGHPDSRIAPIEEIARAYRQIFSRKAKWQMMGYTNAFGDLRFREAIVQMLNHQRGMFIHTDSICITRGSQMAMYLLAQCLFSKGDVVLVENPGYRPAWEAFESAGATLMPVTVDEDGLCIEAVKTLLKKNKRIKAIYTTPHHQYPTTVSLSLQRRMELISLSNQFQFTIIEDDYDNEFHYSYRPLLPMASYAELQNYIYIGTMSKVIAPALRIGYLVSTNADLIQRIGKLRQIIDVQGDTIMEQAVLQLINDGTIKRHLKKATQYYKKKRNYTLQLIEEHLGHKVTFTTPNGGMAFWLEPRKEVDWIQFEHDLKAIGIHFINPIQYGFNAESKGFRLSFGPLSERELEEGIIGLASIL